jgi:hypothetical protein
VLSPVITRRHRVVGLACRSTESGGGVRTREAATTSAGIRSQSTCGGSGSGAGAKTYRVDTRLVRAEFVPDWGSLFRDEGTTAMVGFLHKMDRETTFPLSRVTCIILLFFSRCTDSSVCHSYLTVSKMKNSLRSKTFLTVATVALCAVQSLPAAVIDFSSDPDIAGSWDIHSQLGTPGTATWNAGDQDLDLLADDSGGHWSLLSPTGAERGADEGVTLDVTSLSASSSVDADWAHVGLTIAVEPAPALSSATGYSFWLRSESADGDINNGLWAYEVRDGANNVLFSSASSFIFAPVTLSIERSGNEYDFLVDGSWIYTSSATYTTLQNDSMVNYDIVFGSGQFATLSATVDNFGIIPEPGTYALLGGLFALGCVMLRRRQA